MNLVSKVVLCTGLTLALGACNPGSAPQQAADGAAEAAPEKGAPGASRPAAKQAAQPPTDEGESATVDVAKLGDWGLVCPEGKMTGRNCRILQQALINLPSGEEGDARAQRVLMTMVGYVTDQERPLLSVVAPLGISLARGVLLDVEGYDQLRLEIQRCSESGCLAFLPMQEQLVEAFRVGKSASVTIFPMDGKGRRIRLSLDGFDQAVGALEG